MRRQYSDEGDELAPSRAFNPWTDHGREWTIAAPNAETILRFVVMEGDVLHPQSGKRMAGRNCCAAAAQGSSWYSSAMPQSITWAHPSTEGPQGFQGFPRFMSNAERWILLEHW